MYERIQPIQQSSKTQSYITSRYSQHRIGRDIYTDRSPEHAPIYGHNETMNKERERKRKEGNRKFEKVKRRTICTFSGNHIESPIRRFSHLV
jgi:hypothetical protein